MKIIKTDILGAKKTSVAIIAGLVFSVCCSLTLGSDFVLAYTTTLSTSGIVSVDVSSAADGAAMGTDNVVVNSTCPLGYTLSIGGPTDNALYKGGDNTSTSTIPTTTGTTSTPKALVGEGNLGTWGYSTTANTTATSANFIGLSSAANTLITKASGSASGGDTISVYYGVSVDNTIEPGLYKMSNNNAVTYYLTASANCSIYKIQYNDNGANSSTTMGITHNNVMEDDEITLAASNYKRTGYGFAGWSTVQLNPDAATFQSDLATAKAAGQVFGPNETITATASFLNHATIINNAQVITLYAIWVKPDTNAVLQNWTGCNSLNIGDVRALTDQRDNDTYAVAKLADGNCWMIENLRLGGTSVMGTSVINSSTTNNPVSGFTLSASQDPTITAWCDTDSSACDDQSMLYTGNTTNSVSSMSGTNQNIYSYGNYYNWYSATAGNGIYNSGGNVNTRGDLCPVGWRLPRGGDREHESNNEFWTLVVVGLNNSVRPANYNSDLNPYYTGDPEGINVSKLTRKYPNNFLYTGASYNSLIDGRGSTGIYSSSTSGGGSSYNSYVFGLQSLNVYPGTRGRAKNNGIPIRCLASTEYTISYNANGGTGTMSDQTVTVGDTVNLTSNSFTRTNYVFAGWNTAANGSGTSYANGQSVTDIANPGQTITLYAQWKQLLYDKVASMTKGTQTAANLQTAISSSNSGVYTYNSSVFGASTDANNDYNIYYYRGILDNTTGTYGSDGDAGAYPNYVRLDNNTCWRIVRTTGSGGIKMIYNGVWGSNTCAKATTAAQISSPVSTSVFSGTSTANSKQIVRVGYTLNNTYASTSYTSGVTYTTVMGSNTDYSVNNTDSTIKDNVESWYNSNMSDYTSILEPNAGYCNDRSSFTTSTGTTATSSIRPYVASSTSTGATYVAYFGSYQRNATTAKTPSLTCATTTRDTADTYSTDTSVGGNGQLGAPVGLLTADEASFAGSGRSTATQGSAYHANSFLRTGSAFWTMSPYRRYSQVAYDFMIGTNGALADSSVITANGVRPVISLKHGATIGGGDGTATSPWTLAKYTISFNANGGSGTMSNQIAYSGIEMKIKANTFTAPANKDFAAWNTKADGTGISYDDEDSIKDLAATGGSITLYAQWGSPKLYNLVAAMSKGTQTAADLQAVITKPTSSNPTTDTSNSGVYEYNSSVFGTASDASNTYPIYYYRGILDSNLDDTSSSSYGSNGDGAYYPNYVKLGNTCWRIVRTTGSGGVKMIYNGLYSSGTTANSCANARTNAQITTRAFNGDSTTYQQIVRVGYTYNDTYATNTASTVPISTALGSNSNYAVNNTDSTIKDYLENTWFTSSNGISAYESILEPSAGYCNDRTVFNNTSPYTQQAESTNIVTYGTSGMTVYMFGSYTRNYVANATRTLTLSCPRDTVDLYTTSNATNGNKQLVKPVALLTADEVALSGNGYNGRTAATTYSSNYSYSSFLRSGSNFWLLSPNYRYSDGNAGEYYLTSNGYMNGSLVYSTYGVRPAISLKYGTIPVSGTGTATDPWVVNAP